MFKVSILAAASAPLILCGCAEQPTSTPLPVPRAHTASVDWRVPLGPDTGLAQADDDSEPPTLEDRARALLGDKTLGGTLPNNQLSQEMLFKFLVSEIAAQRGNLQLAAQGYLEMAKSTRDPRLAKRATELAAYGRYQNLALEAARLWTELDKDNPQARQTLAALLVASNKLSEAKPHLQALLEADGNVAAGFMQLHQLLAKYPDRDAVLTVTKDLAKGYSQLPEAHFAVAQAALSANKLDLASAEINQALKLRPDWDIGALFKAQVLQQRTSSTEALAYLQSFLQTYPKARDVRANYARLLINDKQLKEARAQYQLMLEDQPNNPDIVVTVGLLSMQLNDYDAAETYLKRALDLKYRDPDAVRFYLGQTFEERKRYDEAMKYYGAVTGGDQFVPAQARYAYLLGRQGNKLAEARQYLQNVRTTNDEQRALLIQAEAQLLREAKEYQQSYELLSGELQKQPDNADLLYDTAMAAEKLDRLDVVETDLRRLIALKPDHAQAYNALGYTLADRTDRLPEAKQYIEKALKLAPDDPFILDSMGWVLFRGGSYKEALDYLQRAYAQRPDPEIAAHIGEVLWVKGQQKEAEKVWRDASRDNPDNELLQATMKRFLR
ncbi:MAG TPA: tetratricopeptide repeat protein [Burkholderiales bacterium]|nr:tetratricopeptide repeat protein [Burkholderiales bacterium]